MASYNRFIFIIIGSLFLISILLSLTKGSVPTSIYQLFLRDSNNINTILWELRLPRTLTALVCGGLLALSGSLMQLLLQNPLADPYVLGQSSGAAFFTLLMMMLGYQELGLLGGAWFGSLVTILLVLLLTKKHRFQPHTLVLVGVAISCAFSACISFLLLILPDTHLHRLLFWIAGDLNDAHFPWLGLIILTCGLLFCLLLSPGLNLLLRGEIEAKTLGLASAKYKIILYLLSSLFTAEAVTLAGSIGFIGLIVPHLTRLLVGHHHRSMLPTAMLLGSTLLILADTLSRTLIAPEQLPVGMVMALIGLPIFVWLVQR